MFLKLVSISKLPSLFSANPINTVSWQQAGLIQFILGIFAYIFSDEVDGGNWAIVALFLLISGGSLLPNCYRAIRRPAPIVLSDHLFILTIAYLLYFIFGALLLPIGPKNEVDFSLLYYETTASTALKVAGINAIGLGVSLVVSAFAPRKFFLRLGTTALRLGTNIPIGWVISGFLLVGSYAYFLVLIFDADPKPGEVIAGIWRSLANLLLVAIILAAAYTGKNAKFFRFTAIFLAIIQVVAGFLMLNKAQALLPIVALSIGYGWRLGIRKIALPSGIALATSFLLIASPVATVRNVYGSASYIDVNTRLTVLWDEIFSENKNAIESEYYPWARFCYTPAQVAGMDLYDAGQGGYDFKNIGWVFLPRFIFPEKPIITSAGQDIHYNITGYQNSSTGLGVFVDGYYNLGIIGVLFSSAIVGLILGCTSIFAKLAIEKGAVLWFPLALSGDYMAYRIDGFLLGDYIGPFSLLMYMLIGATIASSGLKIAEV